MRAAAANITVANRIGFIFLLMLIDKLRRQFARSKLLNTWNPHPARQPRGSHRSTRCPTAVNQQARTRDERRGWRCKEHDSSGDFLHLPDPAEGNAAHHPISE